MKNILNILLKYPLISIILLAISVRLIVVATYQHIVTTPDSSGYLYLSELISRFDLKGYTGERSPGYPILLSIAGRNFNLIVLFQLLAGVVSMVFTYKTLRILFTNHKYAFYISLAIILYIPLLFYEFTLLTEALTLTFISIITYIFFKIQYTKEDVKANSILLGLLCAYLVIIKPFYIFIPVLLYGLLFIQKKFKNSIVISTFIIIAPAFCFLGWSYVNKINTGYFTSTTFYGINIAQNCVYFAENTSPEYADIGKIYAKHRDKTIEEKGNVAMSIWAAYPELRKETQLSPIDLSKRLYDYSITTIKMNKTAYLKQVFFHSWRIFWKSSIYIPSDYFQIKEQSKTLYYTSWAEQKVLKVIKVLFILFIPINIIACIKRKKISIPFILTTIVLTTSILQALTTYGSNDRFSYPFEILITISVIYNLMFLYKKIKRKKNRNLLT